MIDIVEIDNINRLKILEVIISYAPDNFAKLKYTNSMSKCSIKEVTGALYNGLAYGNWPWVLDDMINKSKDEK